MPLKSINLLFGIHLTLVITPHRPHFSLLCLISSLCFLRRSLDFLSVYYIPSLHFIYFMCILVPFLVNFLSLSNLFISFLVYSLSSSPFVFIYTFYSPVFISFLRLHPILQFFEIQNCSFFISHEKCLPLFCQIKFNPFGTSFFFLQSFLLNICCATNNSVFLFFQRQREQ